MRISFILILLMAFMQLLTAQPPDTIAYKKAFLGIRRYDKPAGEKYKWREFKGLLLSQPSSGRYFYKSRAENWAAVGAGLAGAALSQYGRRDEIERQYYNKPNPYLLASAVLMGGCIYLVLHSIKQRHQAVKAYNNAVRQQL